MTKNADECAEGGAYDAWCGTSGTKTWYTETPALPHELDSREKKCLNTAFGVKGKDQPVRDPRLEVGARIGRRNTRERWCGTGNFAKLRSASSTRRSSRPRSGPTSTPPR